MIFKFFSGHERDGVIGRADCHEKSPTKAYGVCAEIIGSFFSLIALSMESPSNIVGSEKEVFIVVEGDVYGITGFDLELSGDTSVNADLTVTVKSYIMSAGVMNQIVHEAKLWIIQGGIILSLGSVIVREWKEVGLYPYL